MNIAKHRKAAGLSQTQMARALGYARRDTIGSWENNPDKVTLGSLKAYADQCGVTLAELLGFDNEREAEAKLTQIKDIIE